MNASDPVTIMTTIPLPTIPTSPPVPADDGKTHINVHYNHATERLGRMLSTYYVAKFNHRYFGPFKCIEGFMLYARTGCRDDTFRGLTGSQAKRHYRDQRKAGALRDYEIENASLVLADVTYTKLQQHPVMLDLFVQSTLPFDCYYLHGDGNLPIRPVDEWADLVGALTWLRQMLQQGKVPTELSGIDYAKLRKP